MRRIVLVLTAVLLTACAGRSTGGERPARDRNVITAEEIAGLNVSTAFEIVQQLRPEFLRTRGVTSSRDPDGDQAVVYVSGMRMGGPEQLSAISAHTVESIRYINATDATTRFGINHAGGVISLTLRR